MTHKLYWAYVGFIDISGGKKRPVLYLRETDESYIVLRLSSQFDNKSDFIKSKYIEILDWKIAGLSKPSWIDTIQTYTLPIDKTELTYIGQLSERDLASLAESFDLGNQESDS